MVSTRRCCRSLCDNQPRINTLRGFLHAGRPAAAVGAAEHGLHSTQRMVISAVCAAVVCGLVWWGTAACMLNSEAQLQQQLVAAFCWDPYVVGQHNMHNQKTSSLPCAPCDAHAPLCSVAAGALYPAYATYKALVVPQRAAAAARRGSSSSSAASVHSLAGERWLKYWALYGLTVVAERLLDSHLDR